MKQNRGTNWLLSTVVTLGLGLFASSASVHGAGFNSEAKFAKACQYAAVVNISSVTPGPADPTTHQVFGVGSATVVQQIKGRLPTSIRITNIAISDGHAKFSPPSGLHLALLNSVANGFSGHLLRIYSHDKVLWGHGLVPVSQVADEINGQ
jgi:hypothetical protein